ncbi:hypothetical protein [Phenylobacterium sp. SCN 70-31]|uniref:hypothetical protein n=1 Tax=Phenylobacterium sp. SCN 70-31 TaxID=1660129 RepID=UPI0025D3D4E8|nr:hypothetical protein [Phenylobacterium sp. SCN 70-31]
MIPAEMRSRRREVRNPVLALPAMAALRQLDPAASAALAAVLGDLAADARRRAQISWAQNKGVMAAYWKAVGAYATHIRRALRS